MQRDAKDRGVLLLVLLALALTLPSCSSVPILGPPRQPDPQLPDFEVPDDFGGASEAESAATIDWHDFFKEPELVELIGTALDNNQELAVLMQEMAIAQSEALARSGEYLPKLDLVAGAGAMKSGEYTTVGAVERQLELDDGRGFDTFVPHLSLGLGMTWEIDIWKKLRNAKKAAVMRYLATREGRTFMVTHLVAEIAESYYELTALDLERDILEEMMRVQQHALEAVRLQKEAGETTELAVQRFEAEVRKNESRLSLVDQRIIEAENRLNYLAGRYPQTIPRDVSSFDDSLAEPIAFGTPEQLLAHRPDIRRAEFQLAAAKLDVKVARAEFYPKLDVVGWVGYRTSIPSLMFATPESLIANAVGDIMMPVLNRRAIEAEYQSASAGQLQAVYRYRQTVLNAYMEVVNQLSMIRNVGKSLEMKRKQVEALTSAVSAASQLFASAQADYTEVLLTQRDALESRIEYVELRQRQLDALVRTYRALGGGYESTNPEDESEG
jgi:NodT family efflux transporter outer membrane factor (OMF) lipoprotein